MGCRRRCRRHPKTLTPRAGTELGSIPLMKAPASLHNFQPFFCRSGAGWGGMHGVGARAITRSGGVRGALAAHFPPPRPPISSKNEPCVLPPNPPARECFSSGAGGKKKNQTKSMIPRHRRGRAPSSSPPGSIARLWGLKVSWLGTPPSKVSPLFLLAEWKKASGSRRGGSRAGGMG